ncbi:MAG: hypothetical protein RL701_3951 [Pseudomonadota bacterium]|jgi:glycosyltransferase involved in cell wall biosynthesis
MTTLDLPRVSVCLLTYKRAHVLPRTLELLLAQTHANFELIINDDCSPDDTERVCREFAQRDKRVRYVRNAQNLRYANNQNAAILRASCEHVAIVHDGDVYHPQLLAAWTNALVKQPSAALVFNAAEHMNSAGEVTGVFTHPYGPLAPGRRLFEEILTQAHSPIFGIVMVRRSRVLEAGPFDPRLKTLADIDMWLRLLLRYDAAYVREPLYAIAAREDDHHNSFTNWRVRAEAELIYELNWRRGFADDPVAGERVRRQVARMLAKQRALQLAACARHRQFAALGEGLRFAASQPPFGARLEADAVTDWTRLAPQLQGA